MVRKCVDRFYVFKEFLGKSSLGASFIASIKVHIIKVTNKIELEIESHKMLEKIYLFLLFKTK